MDATYGGASVSWGVEWGEGRSSSLTGPVREFSEFLSVNCSVLSDTEQVPGWCGLFYDDPHQDPVSRGLSIPLANEGLSPGKMK